MRLTGCEQPWFELQLEYNRHVRACCCYNAPEDVWDERSLHVERLWNAPQMQLKRRIVAQRVAEGTGCQGCQYLRYGTAGRFTQVPAGLDARQRANYERALANYGEKAIRVDSRPTKYYFNFGLACNFDCIHGSQTVDRGTDRRQRPVSLDEIQAAAATLDRPAKDPTAVAVGDSDATRALLSVYREQVAADGNAVLTGALDRIERVPASAGDGRPS